MTINEFVNTVCHLTAEQQNEFLASLKDVLFDEEWKATASFISLHSMFMSPAKYNAMKEAARESMVEELFGHPYEKQTPTREGVYSTHLTSICSMPILINRGERW